jgi:perosamine synthetase
VRRLITSRTRAVVPTHLYGLPCEMDPILDMASRHGLAVIEDCAHALGASYKGRRVGTFGDAAIFSFQTLKPLNTHGGGMAVVQDPEVGRRVAALADEAEWPTEAEVRRRLRVGALSRLFTRPAVFTITAFPVLWAASWFHRDLNVYQWESARRLDPMPAAYRVRYSNVQAALGLASLDRVDDWNARSRRHAGTVDAALRDIVTVARPIVPNDRTHIYYQYCAYVPDRDATVRACIRRGVDIETRHVDVCPRLPIFQDEQCACPGAERAGDAVQVPVYTSLSDRQAARIASVVRHAVSRTSAGTAISRRGRPAGGLVDERRHEPRTASPRAP